MARVDAATGRRVRGGGSPLPVVRVADAVAPHISEVPEPETFSVYAEAEIAASPVHTFGECFFPDCSRSFNPTRRWQAYCCEQCRAADVREHRLWGHRAASSLLVWRMFKYSKQPAQADLVRAARRYVTAVQSTWLSSRRFRVARAKQMKGRA